MKYAIIIILTTLPMVLFSQGQRSKFLEANFHNNIAYNANNIDDGSYRESINRYQKSKELNINFVSEISNRFEVVIGFRGRREIKEFSSYNPFPTEEGEWLTTDGEFVTDYFGMRTGLGFSVFKFERATLKVRAATTWNYEVQEKYDLAKTYSGSNGNNTTRQESGTTSYENIDRYLFNQFEFGALATFNITQRIEFYGGVNWVASPIAHLFRNEINRTQDGKEYIFEIAVPVGLRFKF